MFSAQYGNACSIPAFAYDSQVNGFANQSRPTRVLVPRGRLQGTTVPADCNLSNDLRCLQLAPCTLSFLR